MDIYTAKNHLDRLVKYSQQVVESDSDFYDKTKLRLEELISLTEEVHANLANALGKQSRISTTGESYLATSIDEMHDILITTSDNVISLLEASNIKPKTPEKRIKHRSHAELKEYLWNLEQGVKNISQDLRLSEDAKRCAELISRWLSVRFNHYRGNSLSYQMEWVSGWVRDIVILWGYGIESNTLETFIAEFNQWLDEIIQSNGASNYMVPYSVYKFSRNPNIDMLTTSSLELMDAFMCCGLGELYSLNDDLTQGLFITDFYYSLGVESLSFTPFELNDKFWSDSYKEEQSDAVK